MTLDILKPTISTETPFIMTEEAIDALVAGLLNDTVYNLHTAVEAVNEACGVKTDGNVVGPSYKSLLRELQNFNSETNRLASQGLTYDEIVIAVNPLQDHFTITDLDEKNIELYGSIEEWLATMVPQEI